MKKIFGLIITGILLVNTIMPISTSADAGGVSVHAKPGYYQTDVTYASVQIGSFSQALAVMEAHLDMSKIEIISQHSALVSRLSAFDTVYFKKTTFESNDWLRKYDQYDYYSDVQYRYHLGIAESSIQEP